MFNIAEMIKYLVTFAVISALAESAVVRVTGEPETTYGLADLKIKFNTIWRMLNEINEVIGKAPTVEVIGNTSATRCNQTCALWNEAKLKWLNAVTLVEGATKSLELAEEAAGENASDVAKTFTQASMQALEEIIKKQMEIKEVVNFVVDFYTVADFHFYVACLNDALSKFENMEMELISAIEKIPLEVVGTGS